VQRLLMGLLCQTPEGAAREARVYNPFLGAAERLAAALQPPADEQPAALTPQPVLPATEVAINAGARPAFSVVCVCVICLVMTRCIIELQRLRSWRVARQPPPLPQRRC